jgi:hypothetical protein
MGVSSNRKIKAEREVASSNQRTSAKQGTSQEQGLAYFSLPSSPPTEARRPGKLKRWIAGAMFLALLGYIGSLQLHQGAEHGPKRTELAAASVAVSAQLADADLDQELTTKTREQLRNNVVPDFIKGSDTRLQEAVLSGERDLYRLKLLDTAAEDGDLVEVTIDGMPMGIVSLQNNGNELILPIRKGSTKMQVKGVRDGGGGITFGFRTSDGRVYSRSMDTGQVEQWAIETSRGGGK